MKPSATLFELIQSLNSEERNQFLRSSSLQQGEKNYLKLFSFIAEMDEYNEGVVKLHFENESFIRHLASEKNQLFHHLLKSLRFSRIKNKNSAYAFDKTKDVDLLYSRGLYVLAQIEAEKLKQLIQKEELYFAHLKLLNVQIQYSPATDTGKKQLLQLLAEKEECLHKINNLNIYQRLLAETEYYFNQNILVHDKSKKHLLESVLSNPFLSDLKQANSTKSLLLATYCRLICYRLIWRKEAFDEELHKALKLFKEYPFLKNEFPKIYIYLFRFWARHLAIDANLVKAREVIEQIRELQDEAYFDTQDLQNTLFSRLAVFDLIFYNYSGNFKKGTEFGQSIEKELMIKKAALPGHEYSAIQFLIFVSYFGTRQFSQSLKYLNEVLNTPFEESRQDLYRYAKICNLIVHYELNNFDYLRYNYKSVLRFFSGIPYPFEYELAFLKHFKSIAISKKQKQNKQLLFKALLDQLIGIFKDPYQKIASEYFDLCAWVNSKINNSTYADEISRQRYLQ